ncbi:hypothetical protein RND71_035376 [Anisodus tanguticus]|uniref:Uncharacterized protein n=1 Tax=Anisodus tanguticus TaxID=243964 RepID=A0AAE1R4E4_9SOLA|nr:hypothetical protein RND71_035376 [Anisodus tanguticus]
MTSLVSISFYKPLQRKTSLALIQGLDSRKSSCCRNLVKNTTASKLYYKIRGMLSMNRSCHSHWMLTAIHIHEQTLLHNFDVSCCTHLLISGFWVGPDSEDGWGFVEAIVYRTC